jgi:hypothetical protein
VLTPSRSSAFTAISASVAAVAALAQMAGCGANGPQSAAVQVWPPIVVTCDSMALSLLNQVYAKRKSLEKLSEVYRAQDRAIDAGRVVPRPTKEQEELERMTTRMLFDCGEMMGAAVTGLDPIEGQTAENLIVPDWAASTKTTSVAMSVFVNYTLRTRRHDFPPLSEIRTDMAEVASQLVPAIFSAYPRLQYVELHAHWKGWTVANMGVTRHGATLLGGLAGLYMDACVGRQVQGLGYSADVQMSDFTFTPNQALVRAGRI